MWVKLLTYYRLGLGNLFRVFVYRLKLKSGLLRRQTPILSALEGPFFTHQETDKTQQYPSSDTICAMHHPLFGRVKLPLEVTPNWFESQLNHQVLSNNRQHWSLISDFESGVGDIKGVWEASRFGWALDFAYLHQQDCTQGWLRYLDIWLEDWSQNNPANQGANWKCAQEASFRVLHLAAVSRMLLLRQPSEALSIFIQQHLSRILPTTGYAVGQDNNHGTSEAAALYVGGSWLVHNGYNNKIARKSLLVGQKLLVNRVTRLIMSDGSFSQYSVTYHRLMLDTLSFVELWRRFLDLPEFPTIVYQRAQAACEWLLCMTNKHSGDAPNLGTNDGAHVLNYVAVPFRDFRPSVELAAQLFFSKSCFDTNHCRALRAMFDLNAREVMPQPSIKKFTVGGYGYMSGSRTQCVLKVPHFEFRPAQADNLHVDFWLDGVNILRDGGSYSYNTEQKWLDYFNGCQSHNTIEFDQRPQMPRVSRFLFAHWPKYSQFETGLNTLSAAYTDWQGVTHQRVLTLTKQGLEIHDQFSGVRRLATLRWRLDPAQPWQVNNQRVLCEKLAISVQSNVPITRFAVAEGHESRYYGEKTPLPVLQVDVASDAIIKTIISWQ